MNYGIFWDQVITNLLEDPRIRDRFDVNELTEKRSRLDKNKNGKIPNIIRTKCAGFPVHIVMRANTRDEFISVEVEFRTWAMLDVFSNRIHTFPQMDLLPFEDFYFVPPEESGRMRPIGKIVLKNNIGYFDEERSMECAIWFADALIRMCEALDVFFDGLRY